MHKLVDVITEDGKPTGRRVTIDQAVTEGLWHAAAHAVIYRKSGYVLVQKRSPKMVFNGDMLDITAGGIVDAGERPEETVQREMREEMGLEILPEDFKFIAVTRYNHAWPTRHKHSRCLTYNYLVELPEDMEEYTFNLQRSEVTDVRWLSVQQLRRLIRTHRLRNFGRLEPTYKYYVVLLKAVEAEL